MKARSKLMVAGTAGLILAGLVFEAQAASVNFNAAAQGTFGIMSEPWVPGVGDLGVTVTANWGGDQSQAASPYLNGTGLGVYVDGLGTVEDYPHQAHIYGNGDWQELVFAFDNPVSFADLTVGLYFIGFNGVPTIGDDPVFSYSGDGGTAWTEISEAALYGAWTQVGDTVNPEKRGNKFQGYISFSDIGGSGDITHLSTRSNKGGYQVSYLKTTSVPDGGMTAMMLGLALLGLGGIARKTRG